MGVLSSAGCPGAPPPLAARRAAAPAAARAPRRRRAPPAPRALGGGGGGGGGGFMDVLKGAQAAASDAIAAAKLSAARQQAGDFDAAAVGALVDATIAGSPVVMFSFTSCPFCEAAKSELSKAGAKFTALELNERPDGKAIRAVLAERTGRTSMPSIWIGGEGIGGMNDGTPGLAALVRSGQLRAKLEAAGAL